MENIKYLKKIFMPEIKRHNFKAKRAHEVDDFIFMYGKNSDIKFKAGQILVGCPSLEELFLIVYSMLNLDMDFKYHSAIVNEDSITLIGYRCWDANTNNYFDPRIDINDFGIAPQSENSMIMEIYRKKPQSKQQLDLINEAIQHFVRCNITKEQEKSYLNDLQNYQNSTTNLV